MSYSVDFRKKVLKIKSEEKLSCREVAKRFKIGVMTVVRWGKRLEPKLIRERSADKLALDARLLKDVSAHPYAFQYERAKRLGMSQAGVWRALKRLKITRKKKLFSSKSRSQKAVYLLPKH